MLGFNKNPKMPRTGTVKGILAVADKEMAEANFRILNVILNAYETELAYIAMHDLQMNEPNRKECMKDLEKRTIPDLQLIVDSLKKTAGYGSVIPNSLLLCAEKAQALAYELKVVCSKGNFQEKGWTEKLVMFEHFAKQVENELIRVDRAFKEGTHPDVRGDVMDDLYRTYMNRTKDWIGHARMSAHTK